MARGRFEPSLEPIAAHELDCTFCGRRIATVNRFGYESCLGCGYHVAWCGTCGAEGLPPRRRRVADAFRLHRAACSDRRDVVRAW